MTLLSSHNQF